MAFNKEKFNADVRRELQRISKERISPAITQNDLKDVGDAGIARMLRLIASGQSPVQGFGRYAAYKWVALSNQVRRSIGAGKSKSVIKRVKSAKYPYNQMKQFPDKKVRPVNLKLSGDFLDALETRTVGKTIKIGFFKEKFAKYESGHREGVNGQPIRPIIPQANERLTPVVFAEMVKTLDRILRRKFRS